MATVFPDFEKLEMNSMETTEKNGTWHNYTGYAQFYSSAKINLKWRNSSLALMGSPIHFESSQMC